MKKILFLSIAVIVCSMSFSQTPNYFPKFSDTTGTLNNSIIYQSPALPYWIGLGTTLPEALLDINGTDFSILKLRNNDTTLSDFSSVLIDFHVSSLDPLAQIGYFKSNVLDFSGGIVFNTTFGRRMFESMRLTDDGKLGLGTANPFARFQIGENWYFDDSDGNKTIGVNQLMVHDTMLQILRDGEGELETRLGGPKLIFTADGEIVLETDGIRDADMAMELINLVRDTMGGGLIIHDNLDDNLNLNGLRIARSGQVQMNTARVNTLELGSGFTFMDVDGDKIIGFCQQQAVLELLRGDTLGMETEINTSQLRFAKNGDIMFETMPSVLQQSHVNPGDSLEIITPSNEIKGLTLSKAGQVGVGVSNPDAMFQVGNNFRVDEIEDGIRLEFGGGEKSGGGRPFDPNDKITATIDFLDRAQLPTLDILVNKKPVFSADEFGNVIIGRETGVSFSECIKLQVFNKTENCAIARFFNNYGADLNIYGKGNTATIRNEKAGKGLTLETTTTNSTTNTNQLYLGTDGNVGIGTSSPSVPLHVVGNTLIDGFLTINTSHLTFGNVAGGVINFGVGSGDLDFRSLPSGGGQHNQLMKLTYDGRLLIGTTDAPSGYKLSVNGKMIAEGYICKLYSEWPDFIFNEDYKLKSLSEVEKFIKKNKHLPDVPSAKEVKENGIDIGEMNVILLQKIEELTIYTIEQQKLIETLLNNQTEHQKKIEELQKKLK